MEKILKTTTQPATLAEQLSKHNQFNLTPIQEAAISLYFLGFNVFPLPYAQKGGYPWRLLQFTRLAPEDLYLLTRDWCNLAVMTGRTSGNLFIIDCETYDTFCEQEQRLRGEGIPIWAVRSGGSKGGGHFYLRCSDGEVANIHPGQHQDLEIRGNRCYVLAPPSLHPATHRAYEWYARETSAPPQVSLQQLDWLSLSLSSKKHKPVQLTSHPSPNLSNSTRDFLQHGAAIGERNNRLFNAACDLAGSEVDHDAATSMLMPVAQRIGLPEQEARDTIKSAYSRPRTAARPEAHAKKTPPAYQRALAWAAQQRWKGREGQSDYSVFLACCTRARNANEKGVFRASCREIATLARVNFKTAAKALKRLTEAKFLIPCGQDHTTGANLYRFSPHTLQNNPQHTKGRISRKRYTDSTLERINSVPTAQKNDAAEPGALGKTAYHLYQFMREIPRILKVKEIVQWVHLSVHQVYRALARLRKFALIEKVKTRYQVVQRSDEELDEQVSRPAGTLGKGEARRRQNEQQRAVRAAKLLYNARWGSTGYIPSPHPPPTQRMVSRWICPNCGQVWGLPGLGPPDICDYCHDFTTWKPHVVPEEAAEETITLKEEMSAERPPLLRAAEWVARAVRAIPQHFAQASSPLLPP